MTTVLSVIYKPTVERRASPQVLAALSRAMREILSRCATQQEAGDAIGLAQGRVSVVARGEGAVEIDTLIGMRNFLKRPIDEILGLSPVGGAPEPSLKADIKEVLDFYKGRWDHLPLDLPSLAARRGVPAEGWKVSLDQMATAFEPAEPSIQTEADEPKPRRKRPRGSGARGKKGRKP